MQTQSGSLSNQQGKPVINLSSLAGAQSSEVPTTACVQSTENMTPMIMNIEMKNTLMNDASAIRHKALADLESNMVQLEQIVV